MSISPTTQDRIFEQFRVELEKNAKASSTEITNAKVEDPAPELKLKAKRAPAKKTQAPVVEATANVTDAGDDEVVPEKCQFANKSDNKPCKNACKFSFVKDGVTVYACGMHCKNVATRVELAKAAPAAKTTATTAKAPTTKTTATVVDKRKPSAYNEFMKTHLAAYKAENPLVMHKDAFMKVASMWATAPENPNRK